MRFVRCLSLFVMAACALAAMPVHSSAQSNAGAYTIAQANAGAKLYDDNCAICHGPKLQGDDGPVLAGDGFLARWNGRTAADLYQTASTQMPQTAPGSLKPDEYLALVAFILQQNKYPDGPAALDVPSLKSVVPTPQKK